MCADKTRCFPPAPHRAFGFFEWNVLRLSNTVLRVKKYYDFLIDSFRLLSHFSVPLGSGSLLVPKSAHLISKLVYDFVAIFTPPF